MLFPIFQTRRFVISESTGYKIHCLIFKVHPRLIRGFCPVFLALEYYTTNFIVCQPLFEKKFFWPKTAQTVDIISFFRLFTPFLKKLLLKFTLFQYIFQKAMVKNTKICHKIHT